MIRYLNCMKRRQDVSLDQFRKYWNDPRFTDLLARMQAMFGAKRATRNLTLSVEANVVVREMRGTREPYDGVLEYWWDEARALLDIVDTPEAQKLIDEMRAYQSQFVDFSASTAFFTEG